MKLNIIFVLLLIFGAPSISFGCSDHPLISTTLKSGDQIGIFISEQQINESPEWAPSMGEPHLSISEAYRLAKKWAKEKYARYDDVQMREISLRKYGCSLVKNRWYYLIELEPIIDGNVLYGSGNWVAILLDGTIIEPKKY